MLDIVYEVANENDDETKKRDTSVPIWGDRYVWWTTATRAKVADLKKQGVHQKDIAAKLGFSESEVSRAISREKPLFEVLIALADEFQLPYPVLLPESEEEALHLATQRRLFRRDLQVAQIAGATNNPDGGGGGGMDRSRKTKAAKQPRR